MGFIGKLFGKKDSGPAWDDGPDWSDPAVYDAKMALFEEHLGKAHENVLAAIIGWGFGGPVDLWVFPGHVPGAVLTTMQLVYPGRTPQKRSSLGKFELAGATRQEPRMGEADDAAGSNEWDRASLEIRGILSTIAAYSESAVVEPLQTAEIPNEDGTTQGLIFDALIGADGPVHLNGEKMGVLLCVAVHPSELAYARSEGVASLISKLRDAGYYPYSDLDRPPVA